MANISQIKLPDNTTYDIKDARIANTDITNWNAAASGRITVTMGIDEPSNPIQGDIWFVEWEDQTLYQEL